MKTTTLIAISLTVLVLWCTVSQAQDSDGTLGPVDLSVHAGVEERAQPDPSQGSAKPRATPSGWSSHRWSSRPAKTAVNSPAPSARATSSNLDDLSENIPNTSISSFQPGMQQGSMVWPSSQHAIENTSGKVRSKIGSFSILRLQNPNDSSRQFRLSLPTWLQSVSPETQSLHGPFEGKNSARTFDSVRPTFSDGKEIQARQGKGRRAKSGRFDTGTSAARTTDLRP